MALSCVSFSIAVMVRLPVKPFQQKGFVSKELLIF